MTEQPQHAQPADDGVPKREESTGRLLEQQATVDCLAVAQAVFSETAGGHQFEPDEKEELWLTPRELADLIRKHITTNQATSASAAESAPLEQDWFAMALALDFEIRCGRPLQRWSSLEQLVDFMRSFLIGCNRASLAGSKP